MICTGQLFIEFMQGGPPDAGVVAEFRQRRRLVLSLILLSWLISSLMWDSSAPASSGPEGAQYVVHQAPVVAFVDGNASDGRYVLSFFKRGWEKNGLFFLFFFYRLLSESPSTGSSVG